MTKTQEAVLRMQVDNLSLEVERQNEEIKKLTAVVRNHARFLKAGEDDIAGGSSCYDILDPTNAENLRNYILTTMEYNMTIDMPTPKVIVHGVNHD